MVRRRFERVVLGALAMLLLPVGCTRAPEILGGGPRGTTVTTRVKQPRNDRRPNVVVIMTDDQRWDEMQFMPKTKKLIGAEGTTFNNSFVSFSLCCPSRASQLSGQYAHNHKVFDNVAPAGGNDKLNHTNTVPVWLQRAGYMTGHVGKYLNQYGEKTAPVVEPGYDDWFTSIDPTTYHYWGYDVLDNAKRVTFGEKPVDYQTDVFAQRAVDDINRFSDSGKPFYLTVWPLAPHSAEGKGVTAPLAPAPATRYAGTKPAVKAPRPPSFMEADMSDKPEAIRELRRTLEADIKKNNISQPQLEAYLDQIEQARAESLLSVDDLVEQVIGALKDNGQLDNTLVIFTSDNGWLLGEHGIALGKVVAFEESIRVPLLVRGPNFPKGSAANQPVVNVDIPATVLEATGVPAGLAQDGTSLLGPAKDANLRRDRAILIESMASGVKKYEGVRTPGWSYVRYEDGEEELYDLFNDANQLDNRAADPAFAKAKARLGQALDVLQTCKGPACVTTIPGSDLR